ncbi:MAG TPA: cytochrome c oxidase subunit 3 family protein [Verrucomicrobiae bacterium]|jgi:cytochrome c oxidase subunit 3|nr:cytochrome c oxidase subunit 3 family protein [Verrucomicrobiae bacterium]
MADAHAALQEQFEEMPQQKEAATLGMWAFLATEVLFFGAMFMSYIVYRQTYPQAFAEASHHTIVLFGTVNTAILLTSSLTMALAVQAARENNIKWLFRFLAITVVFALAFLAVKGLEYHQDLQEHLWPGPHFRPELPPQAQIFWMLYWIMTGVHALHVTVGVGLLSTMAWMTSRRKFSDAYYTPVEMTGLYWHFVDIIWIYLYPLLYLVHRYAS